MTIDEYLLNRLTRNILDNTAFQMTIDEYLLQDRNAITLYSHVNIVVR